MVFLGIVIFLFLCVLVGTYAWESVPEGWDEFQGAEVLSKAMINGKIPAELIKTKKGYIVDYGGLKKKTTDLEEVRDFFPEFFDDDVRSDDVRSDDVRFM